jgi:hypothetical protein
MEIELNTWYENFLEILQKKFSKKIQLTHAMMDLLGIEREAVYRRLRKDVILSAHEIVKIASEWNISLDDITGTNPERVSFHMRQINYISPSDEEVNFLQFVIKSIDYLKNFPETEFMDICNKLPRQLLAGYENLNKFYLFKSTYQYGNEEEVLPFSKIVISEQKHQLTTQYYQAIKQVPNTNFIWDRRLFYYLVNDIRYFNSILLITNEEKELIKKELHDLLDYMLEVANKGCYPETQNKVNLYISQLNIDTNYSYTMTPDTNICFIHVFGKYEIYSFNSEMVNNFMTWMQLKKKTSIQISEVDEKSRIEFFMQQKQWIDSL